MFDLDAAVGALTNEPLAFTWGGKTFELPNVLDLPLDRQLALVNAIDGLDAKKAEPAELLAVLSLILGEELQAELSAVKPLSAVGVMSLLGSWVQFQEAGLGKSPASPASSKRTAPRSKPTLRSGRARRTS